MEQKKKKKITLQLTWSKCRKCHFKVTVIDKAVSMAFPGGVTELMKKYFWSNVNNEDKDAFR